MRETAGQPGEIVSIAYVDGMGRGRGTFQEATGGRFAVSGMTRFGRRGQPAVSFHPFYVGNADFIGDPGARLAVTTTFDAKGRALVTTQPDGAQSRVSYAPLSVTAYDENDSDPQSPHFDTPATSFSDGLGRTTIVREQQGSQSVDTAYRYDALGNVLSVVDQNGTPHRYSFDGRSRQISVSDPNAGTWRLEYNDANDVLARIDGSDNRVQYSYDLLGRVTAEDHVPASGERRESVRYYYDGIGARSEPASMQSYQLGRLSWVQDEAGEEHYGYDSRGRSVDTVHRFSDGADGAEYHTFSDYDAADRVTFRGFPDGSMLAMEYNSRGLPVTVPGLVDNATYTAWGDVQEIHYANGLVDTSEFDVRLRQTRMSAIGPGGHAARDLSYEFDPASQILSITDGRAGIPARQSLSQSFVYDDRYRLVASLDSEAESTWALDSVGNLLEVASGHDDVHLNASFTYGGSGLGPDQLSRMGNRTFSYDASGRVLSDGVRQLQWDAKGRLASVQRGDIAESYTYRFSGARAEKTTIDGDKTTITRSIAGDVEERDGKLIRYLAAFGKAVKLDRDGATPAAAGAQELATAAGVVSPDAQGRIAKWYTSLMAALFCLFAWFRRQSERGSAIGQRTPASQWAIAMRATVAASLLVFASCGGQPTPKYSHDGELVTEWPEEAELTLRDHLGSGVAVVDKNAADRFQRSYHPYGSTRSEFVADRSAASTTGQAAHYVGNERDVGADLGHFHARPYDYQVARFLGPDPLRLFPNWDDDGKSKGIDNGLYSYSSGNPIGRIDPDGMDDWDQGGHKSRHLKSANEIENNRKLDPSYYTDGGNFTGQVESGGPFKGMPCTSGAGACAIDIASFAVGGIVGKVAGKVAGRLYGAFAGRSTRSAAGTVAARGAGGTAKVTTWAEAGITPDLTPGRWVQLGEASKLNFWKTGLPGPKAFSQSKFPYFRIEGPKVPFTNSVTAEVPTASLQWPTGFERLKGLFGQRQIRPKK